MTGVYLLKHMGCASPISSLLAELASMATSSDGRNSSLLQALAHVVTNTAYSLCPLQALGIAMRFLGLAQVIDLHIAIVHCQSVTKWRFTCPSIPMQPLGIVQTGMPSWDYDSYIVLQSLHRK